MVESAVSSVVVVVILTDSGSTLVEGLVGTLVGGLEVTIVVVVDVHRDALFGVLTETGTRTVTATTELLCSLSLLTFP